MIRFASDVRKLVKENQTVEYLNEVPEFHGHGRLFAKITLNPGGEIKYHIHTGETETYFVCSGKGMYNDNGTELEVQTGDVTYTNDGEGHGIINNSDSDLVIMALVINS